MARPRTWLLLMGAATLKGYARLATAPLPPPPPCTGGTQLFSERTRTVNGVCCDEPSEDCSSGRPATCNLGCARVLLPYFRDCGAALPGGAAQFAAIVALCNSAEAANANATAPPPPPPPPPSLAFLGSRILTPAADAALAGQLLAGSAPAGHERWELCFSSFVDDASDPSTFHARCDQYESTGGLARHGPVPQRSSAGHAQRHPEYDAASPAWVPGASWVFGGYVRDVTATRNAAR